MLAAVHLTRREPVMQVVRHNFGCELPEFNGDDGHVHLIVAFPDGDAVSAGRQPQWHLRR